MNRVAPDLIVFSYGTDESFDDRLDLADYETKVSAVIARLRESAPQASFLIIGPPDVARMPKFASSTGRASDVCRALSSSERTDYIKHINAGDPRLARWHPPLNLDAVRATLRRVAAAHQAFFWDWSKLMGGSAAFTPGFTASRRCNQRPYPPDRGRVQTFGAAPVSRADERLRRLQPHRLGG